MFKTIWDLLYTKINALVATTKLNVVYNYDNTEWLKYPYATITPSDTTETIFDNTLNQIEIPFTIRLYDEWDTEDLSSVEDKLRVLVDTILQSLRTDPTLSWNTLRAWFTIRWGYSWDQSKYRVIEINTNYLITTSYL